MARTDRTEPNVATFGRSGFAGRTAPVGRREVDHALKNLSSSIEPVLIVVVGGMVLVLALGIFMPLWEVISKAGQM